MLDRAILHLTVIVESVDAIRAFVANLDQSSFVNHRLTRDAVAMNLQIIGESARKLTAAERAEAPHDYRTINWDLVWLIIQDELGDLRGAASRMLVARGEPAP